MPPSLVSPFESIRRDLWQPLGTRTAGHELRHRFRAYVASEVSGCTLTVNGGMEAINTEDWRDSSNHKSLELWKQRINLRQENRARRTLSVPVVTSSPLSIVHAPGNSLTLISKHHGADHSSCEAQQKRPFTGAGSYAPPPNRVQPRYLLCCPVSD